jgi:hypothetical protein
VGNDSAEEFVKIVVDLPEAEDGVGGEGLWTIRLGEDLYEVRNSPWHTLEINFCDVVRAVAPDESKKPVFVEVVRRGGHRSIHIIFFAMGMEMKDKVLGQVNTLGGTYEGSDGELFAIDLEPDINFDAVADYLLECEEKGWLDVRYAPQPQSRGTAELLN